MLTMREVNGGTPDCDPGIVDENVQSTVRFHRRPDHRFDAGFIGHVDVDRRRVKTDRNHFGRYACRRVFVEIRDHHPSARHSEGPSGLPAYSARAAGDDRDAIVETHEVADIYHCVLGCAELSRFVLVRRGRFSG